MKPPILTPFDIDSTQFLERLQNQLALPHPWQRTGQVDGQHFYESPGLRVHVMLTNDKATRRLNQIKIDAVSNLQADKIVMGEVWAAVMNVLHPIDGKARSQSFLAEMATALNQTDHTSCEFCGIAYTLKDLKDDSFSVTITQA
ncbi:MAG: hypothetical protein KGS72_27005 [Cyanobacteria bacterium REEB67]|nr:hypothetical protein [Cyanobacteria bacterium REEB67]